MDSPSGAAPVPIKVHGLEPGLLSWLAGASVTFEIPKSVVAESAAHRHLLAFEKQRAPALLRHAHWAAVLAGMAVPLSAWVGSGGLAPFRAGVGIIQGYGGLFMLFLAWHSWQTMLYVMQCRDGGVYRDLLLAGEHPVVIVAAARRLSAASLRRCFPLMLGPAMGASLLTTIGYVPPASRFFASLPFGPLPWGLALLVVPTWWMLRTFRDETNSREGEFVPASDAWLSVAGNGTVGDQAVGWLRTMNALGLLWGGLGVAWFFVDHTAGFLLTCSQLVVLVGFLLLRRAGTEGRIASLTPDQFADLFAVFAERGDARAVMDSLSK